MCPGATSISGPSGGRVSRTQGVLQAIVDLCGVSGVCHPVDGAGGHAAKRIVRCHRDVGRLPAFRVLHARIVFHQSQLFRGEAVQAYGSAARIAHREPFGDQGKAVVQLIMHVYGDTGQFSVGWRKGKDQRCTGRTARRRCRCAELSSRRNAPLHFRQRTRCSGTRSDRRSFCPASRAQVREVGLSCQSADG